MILCDAESQVKFALNGWRGNALTLQIGKFLQLIFLDLVGQHRLKDRCVCE